MIAVRTEENLTLSMETDHKVGGCQSLETNMIHLNLKSDFFLMPLYNIWNPQQ
jgi:hypothetical protein